MEPVGNWLKNDDAASMGEVTGSNQESRLNYYVMYSRYRSTTATTAVDIGAPEGARLLSPISGIVVELKQYNAYGSIPDFHLEIQPDGADPRYRVALIHFSDPMVAVGNRVVAGKTPLGIVHNLGTSQEQLNEYCPGEYPHVHMQINDISIPK